MDKDGSCNECGDGAQCDGGTVAPYAKKEYYGNPDPVTSEINPFGIYVLDTRM